MSDIKLVKDTLELLYANLPVGADIGRYHEAQKYLDKIETALATPPKPTPKEVQDAVIYAKGWYNDLTAMKAQIFPKLDEKIIREREVLNTLITAAQSQSNEQHRNDLMDKIVEQKTEIAALKANAPEVVSEYEFARWCLKFRPSEFVDHMLNLPNGVKVVKEGA